MMLKIDGKAKLNNGVLMPYLGLGVYQSGKGAETQNAVKWALEAGYRLIDTARLYYNEDDVGIAIQQSLIPREEIFITTKLWNSDHSYDKTIKAFYQSLKTMKLDYIDLYLIHWPGDKSNRKETWKGMEKIYEEGKCKAIGVSNYTVRHLEETLEYAQVIPAVNQVEFSPFLYQKELHHFCLKNNIQLEAYTPLVRGKKMKNKVLQEVAVKYSKTPAQILIRWALEHKIVVIPKSVNNKRIHENADVFDITLQEEDMSKLDALNENYRASWDPSNII